MPDWKDIPQFPRACYEIHVNWKSLEFQLESEIANGLQIDPEFQRCHVWTEAQRIAYLEYCLMGGEVGRNITIACTNWSQIPTPSYVLVDGKQRIETVRRFLRGEIPVFGHRLDEYTGELRIVQSRFVWRVVECKTPEDILRLYLNINGGGTPHTQDELDRVRVMLKTGRF